MDINRLMTLQGTLFLLTAAGILVRKCKILPESARDVLTDLVIYVVLPCNLAYAFRMDVDQRLIRGMAAVFGAAWAIQAVAWVLSRLLYNRYPAPAKRVLQYATVCSNGGFMGNPIAESVYGAQGLMFASIFLIPQRIFMWSAGISLFTEAPSRRALVKKVATHPCIIAVYIGLALMVFRPRLPAFVDQSVTSLGNCTTPLSMLMVGMILAEMEDYRSLFSWDVIRYTVIRLAVLPFIMFIGCRMFHVDPLAAGVSVLMTAMPAPCMSTILAAKYHGDMLFASKCVVFSTAMTLVSLPLWCMALMYIY